MAVQYEGSCALPEGLRHYLLRGNVMVPLVPADQLPYQLRWIPRQLSHRQMSDEGWKFFKETNDAPSMLSLHVHSARNLLSHYSTVGQAQYLAPGHHVRTEPQNSVTTDRAGQWSQLPSGTAPTSAVSRPQFTARGDRSSPSTDTTTSIHHHHHHKDAHRPRYPSGIAPDPSKKEYCAYWIRNGECDFIPIGCKYKHEMPSLAKLRELGISNEIPKWWRNKNAPKPQTWLQQKVMGKGDVERMNGVHVPREFPDPSTFKMRGIEERGGDGGDVQRKGSPAKTPPSAPVQTHVRCAAPITNLIDLEEDAHASLPSSPQQSPASSGASSGTLTPSSRSSATSPLPPVTLSATLLPIDTNITREEMRGPETKKPKEQACTPRRPSRTSWASSTSSDDLIPTPPSTTTTIKPIKQPHKRIPSTLSTPRNVDSRHGLANPKYAVPPSTSPSPSSSKETRHTKPPTEHRVRRANRKGKSSEGRAMGLQVEIEQRRREGCGRG